MSCGELLMRARLLYACRRLADDPWQRIDALAHGLGYADATGLARLFRRQLGAPPSAVRDGLRGEHAALAARLRAGRSGGPAGHPPPVHDERTPLGWGG